MAGVGHWLCCAALLKRWLAFSHWPLTSALVPERSKLVCALSWRRCSQKLGANSCAKGRNTSNTKLNAAAAASNTNSANTREVSNSQPAKRSEERRVEKESADRWEATQCR